MKLKSKRQRDCGHLQEFANVQTVCCLSHVDPAPPRCTERLSDGKTSLLGGSDDQLPVRAGNQSVQHPHVKEVSPVLSVGAGYQHIRAKSPGGRWLFIRLVSAVLVCVCLVKIPEVCVCVHLCLCFELLTEVTLGLFLHSGDGAVLVSEQELLELGHLIL